jgi:hypothetical protein
MQFIKNGWFILTAVVAALFAVATMDSKQVTENYVSFEKWVMSSPPLEGSWSSSYAGEDAEGLSENKWLESPEQTVVEIDVHGRDVSGIISTPQIRKFIENTPQMVDYFMFEGHRSMFAHSFDARVYEHIGGHKYAFAILSFDLQDGKLSMTDKSPGGSTFVPQEALLIKRSETSFDNRLKYHLEEFTDEKMKLLSPLIEKLRKDEEQKNRHGR